MATKRQAVGAKGDQYIWYSAIALAMLCMMLVAVIALVAMRGLGNFWPKQLIAYKLTDGRTLVGELAERVTIEEKTRLRIHIGNRDLSGESFLWIKQELIIQEEPASAYYKIERPSYGPLIATIKSVSAPGARIESALDADRGLLEAIRVIFAENAKLDSLRDELKALTATREALVDVQMEARFVGDEGVVKELDSKIALVDSESWEVQSSIEQRLTQLKQNTATFMTSTQQETTIPILDILHATQPNEMSFAQKVAHYVVGFWDYVTEEPREANTEGGVMPAILGTVLMVMLMSILVMPLGVLAAIYLHEYAKEGLFVRLVRISVNNLAGVPSIVYGVFGLGFFVYKLGGSIDDLFYAHKLPTPSFGTGGILWASATLALLTVPVVIVSTEEALASIPSEIRHGSLALGATRFQTLVRILLPMSTPGILTGFVLAVARAAGEVAPLMLTGAVKLAPALPFDTSTPFVHLDRKFMHLGFHIYDLAFQSPNVEAVLPMVYTTTALLLGLVIILSASAMVLRNRLRRRYATGAF